MSIFLWDKFSRGLSGLVVNPRTVFAFSPAVLFAAGEQGGWFDYGDAANLDWRRNLLTYTEDFSNAAWVKGGATVTADKLVENTASATTHSIAQAYMAPSGAEVIFSIDLKAGERSWVRLTVNTASGANASAYFDISSGVVGSIAGGSASIESVGDGWYRCAVSGVLSTANPSCSALLATTDGGQTYTGDGVSGAYARSPQLEVGSTATDYQKITDVVTETRALFPKATLYQDTAGTTPVTTPGQTVALALDKSQGLVLGPELVTNGDFSAGVTGWSVTAGNGTISAVAGELLGTCGTTGLLFSSTITTVIGKTYRLSVDARRGTFTDILQVGFSGTPTATPSPNVVFTNSAPNQTKEVVFTATSTTTYVNVRLAAVQPGATVYIDNISVRELPGNHAIQGTALQRPTYGVHPVTGIRNLLTYTEQFDNAVWSKTSVTVSADAATAPNGSTTADLVELVGAAGNNQAIFTFYTISANMTYSLWIKAITAADVGKTISLDSTGGGAVAKTLSLTADWQFVFISPSPNGYAQYRLISSPGATATQFYIWGAQLETGSTATAYQRVTSQWDVSEAGVAQIGYLSFDGVDDGMVTSTITPGVDKAQVFAGVRKLSDAASAMLLEASADSSVNAGSVFVTAPGNVGAQSYGFRSRGTTAAADALPGVIAAAPTTNVLTGLGDISGDRSTLRVDGSQVAQSTADQGTGNYLAYPLYIGRRGGTTLPFNGRMYQLIVRFGPNLSDAQIAATEAYVAGKTGVEL
jgi:hypothetical protein